MRDDGPRCRRRPGCRSICMYCVHADGCGRENKREGSSFSENVDVYYKSPIEMKSSKQYVLISSSERYGGCSRAGLQHK